MAGREYPKWDDPRLRWDMPGLFYDLPLASYITDPPDLKKKGIRHAMELPRDMDELESLGYSAADGASQLEDVIPLATNRHDDIVVDVRAFTQARGLYDTASAAVKVARQWVRDERDNSRGWLMLAKQVLAIKFGKKWSAVWAQVGFNERDLVVPSELEEIVPILRAHQAYLTAHPEDGSSDARFNVTAARAAEVVANAELALNNNDTTGATKILGLKPAISAQEAAEHTRDLTEESLRRRLRGLHAELEQKIPADSPYWVIFGFDQPGSTGSPDAITGATAEPIGSGRIAYRWTNGPRATYTQLWLKNPDDTWTRRETISGGTEITLDGFTPGQIVTAKLRPGNESGYGPYTEEITVTVT